VINRKLSGDITVKGSTFLKAESFILTFIHGSQGKETGGNIFYVDKCKKMVDKELNM